MLERIWLVDDDPINNLVCETLIQITAPAIEVVSFGLAQEALDALNQGLHPDLIFLDLNMPGLDGWDFLNALRRLHLQPAPRIRILSSSIDRLDIQRSGQYPEVEAYHSKPLSPQVITEL